MYLANNMKGPYGYQLNSWMGYPAKIKSQQQQQQQYVIHTSDTP
jgi:hypothetical protein